MKKVGIVGTVGVPAAYGGFESLVENLLLNNVDDTQYCVVCSGKQYNKRNKYYKNARLKYVNLYANGYQSIVYDFLSMLKCLKMDTILLLGVSGCVFLPIFRLIYRGRIISNIDGLEWMRGKWNKLVRAFLRISEMFAVRFSDSIIGDNEAIIGYIFSTYKKKAALIEYGADHVQFIEKSRFLSEYEFVRGSYAVTVCRIEPENNIAMILKAFCNAKRKFELVIIGNWNNSNYGERLRNRFQNVPHIRLLDPIYDLEHINFIRSHASIYIHGHSAGGTNPSLVEAMYLGLPVFAFDCIYNRMTTENKALYWGSIKELSDLLQLEFDMSCLKDNMKAIANERYRWEKIVRKYNKLF